MEKKQYHKIEHNDSCNYYPLSFQQERIWFMSQTSPNSSIWTKTSCKVISTKDFDVDKYVNAVKNVMLENEVLRYKIKSIDNSSIQYLDTSDNLDKYFVYENIPDEQGIKETIDKISNTAVDIYNDTLFKSYIFNGNNCYYILLRLHHIISDAITFRLLWNKILEKYNNVDREPCRINYGDYAKWQRNEFTDELLLNEKAVWNDIFKDYSNVLNLPFQNLILKNDNYIGDSFEYYINNDIFKKIVKSTFRMRVTPYSVYLGAYALLIHFLSQQDDIVIGTVFNGRHSNVEIKEMLGFFVNTIALRVNNFNNFTILDFIKKINNDIKLLYHIQDYPYERLVSDLNLKHSFGLNPLIRTSFNFINNYYEKYSFVANDKEQYYQSNTISSQYDIAVDILYSDDSAFIHFNYSKLLYNDRKYIEYIAGVYENLLDFIIDNQQLTINEITVADFGTDNIRNETQNSKSFSEELPNIQNESVAINNNIIDLIDTTKNVGIIINNKNNILVLDALEQKGINYYIVPDNLNTNKLKTYIKEHNIKYLIYDNSNSNVINETDAILINYDSNLNFESKEIQFNESSENSHNCKGVLELLSESKNIKFLDNDCFRFFYQCVKYISNVGGIINWDNLNEDLECFDTLIINSDLIENWLDRINNSSIKNIIILYSGNKSIHHIIRKIDNKTANIYYVWRVQQNDDFYLYSVNSNNYRILFSNTTLKIKGLYDLEILPEICGCTEIIIFDDNLENGKLVCTTNLMFKKTITNEFVCYGDKRKQIYIRGLLIPIIELQNYIESFDNVEEAYLTKDSSDDELVLYVCGNEQLDINKLKHSLSSTLPPIFTPGHIYEVERFSRNLNGSINIERSPKKISFQEEKINSLELNDTQKKIYNIIKEILNDQTFSLNDNFLNVGGHSLKALQIIVRLNMEFKINVPIDKIFTLNNISKIILFVEEEIKNSSMEEGCI